MQRDKMFEKIFLLFEKWNLLLKNKFKTKIKYKNKKCSINVLILM